MKHALLVLLLVPAAAFAQLPDHKLTPGVARPLSKAAVCTVRWGKDARHVTLSMKKQAFASYGIPWSQHAKYEVDHLISRELGGADAVANLWPERWTGEWNAHQKDRAENATHRAVCRGDISLKDAQQQIARDWTVLYRRFVGTP